MPKLAVTHCRDESCGVHIGPPARASHHPDMVAYGGNGLCRPCARKHSEAGTLIDFPPLHYRAEELHRLWLEYQELGYSRQQAADMIGVRADRLDRAVCRARARLRGTAPESTRHRAADLYRQYEELAARGVNIPKAAELLGVKTNTLRSAITRTRQRARERAGIPTRDRGLDARAVEAYCMKARFERGATNRRVSRELGLTLGGLQDALARARRQRRNDEAD